MNHLEAGALGPPRPSQVIVPRKLHCFINRCVAGSTGPADGQPEAWKADVEKSPLRI